MDRVPSAPKVVSVAGLRRLSLVDTREKSTENDKLSMEFSEDGKVDCWFARLGSVIRWRLVCHGTERWRSATRDGGVRFYNWTFPTSKNKMDQSAMSLYSFWKLIGNYPF